MAGLVAAVGADGIFADTVTGVPLQFFEELAAQGTAERAAPVVVEAEMGMLGSTGLSWNTMSFGYGWGSKGKETPVPSVSWYKLVEPRHMVHVCERWNTRQLGPIQNAFFNGIGWGGFIGNIWGTSNYLSPRDAATLRRTTAIQWAFSHLLRAEDWQPWCNRFPVGTTTAGSAIHASSWKAEGEALWTLISRNETHNVSGTHIIAKAPQGTTFWDVYRGVKLHPQQSAAGDFRLDFTVEALGVGAIYATAGPLSGRLVAFLATMRHETQRALGSFSSVWPGPLPQTMLPNPRTAPYRSPPQGMVLVPSADSYIFEVNGTEIEGTDEYGVDFQYPFEAQPSKFHSHTFDHPRGLYMDRFPVTNRQWADFVNASGYAPRGLDTMNYLKHWAGAGTYPAGSAEQPVTYVSIEDARSYCKWYGRRLPDEWEWQRAAQGGDPHRIFPWGDLPPRWGHHVPLPSTGRLQGSPASVGSYPGGASLFGLYDMVGNVWQWTNEFQDRHTRAAVLRGGSFYQPNISRFAGRDQWRDAWYFPGTTIPGITNGRTSLQTSKWAPGSYSLRTHAKLLLLGPSIDRAGTIGFRCVADSYG